MKKLMVLCAALLLVGCSSSEPEVDPITMLEEKVATMEQSLDATTAEAMELKAEAANLDQRAEAIETSLEEMKEKMSQ